MIFSAIGRARLREYELHVVAGMELDDLDVDPWDLAIGRITPAERIRVGPWFRVYDELVAWVDSDDFIRAVNDAEGWL